MLTRRDTLRLLGLSVLATSPLLGACGGHSSAASPAPDPGGIRLVSADVARSPGDDGAIGDVVTAMSDFADRLWPELGGADANLALSPYSIVSALAMTANGADGGTLQQMHRVLGITDLSRFNGGLNALTRAIEALAGPVELDGQDPETIELTAANQLFGDAATTFGPGYLETLARDYGAGVRTVDFRHDPAAAETLINAWTSTRTHERIPEILPPGALDELTRLVLVNALYLKAPWATPFESSATSRHPFHLTDGSTVEVDTMRGLPESGSYLRGDHYVAARLPYAGGTLAMTVALADPGKETAALAGLLSGGVSATGEHLSGISLPKWKYRVGTDLRQPLVDLGMGLAFSDRAQFAPMSPSEPVEITDVFHQTFVAVDEAGTEAAAATATVMGATSAQAGGGSLVCDRPFLFVLHDTAHGTPLFVGRVADPR